MREWKVLLTRQDFARTLKPVFNEGALQARHSFAFHSNNRVAPARVLRRVRVPLVGVSRSTNQAHLPIDHKQYAVRPIVEARHRCPAKRMILRYSTSGIEELLKIVAGC